MKGCRSVFLGVMMHALSMNACPVCACLVILYQEQMRHIDLVDKNTIG